MESQRDPQCRAPIRRIPAPGLLVAALSVALTGCDLFTGDRRDPTTITVTPAEVSFDAVGETAILTVEVLDQDGAVMPDVEVDWNASPAGVVDVSGSGVVTSLGNGGTTVTAAAGSAIGEATVSVSQLPTAAEIAGGGDQEGPAGEPLSEAISVRVLDRLGQPTTGITVAFQVDAGSGSLDPTEAVTGSDGVASTSWRLGEVAGEPQQLSARVLPPGDGGGGLSQVQDIVRTFTAVARPGAPDVVAKISGSEQAAQRLTTLPENPTVRVLDRFDNPVPGVLVQWSVVSGNGSTSPESGITDEDGTATTTWTLGSPLGAQSLQAAIPDGPEPVLFDAISIAVPAELEAAEGSGQSTTVGEALPVEPGVRVLDEFGLPIPFASVTFTVISGGGSLDDPAPPLAGPEATSAPAIATPTRTVQADAQGIARAGPWTLGTTAGPNTLRATIEGLTPVTFVATGLPGPVVAIEEVSGDQQTGPTKSTLPTPITVRTVDTFGNPSPGGEVTFVPDAESGSVSPASATSVAGGLASTEWTLGAAEGTHTLTASLAGGPSVVFTATATAGGDGIECGGAPVNPDGYDIEYCYTAPVSPEIEAAFDQARATWSAIITGDQPDVPFTLPKDGPCGSPVEVTQTFDDLFVLIEIVFIDGPGGVLGSAGPCRIRSSTGLPGIGVMRFDEADVQNMLDAGVFDEVIVHELGHVLGFGTLWSNFGLLGNPTSPTTPGVEDTHFLGSQAMAEFDAAGGTLYSEGEKVPVENNEDFGPGTYNGHWRESVFDNELMTGFISNGSNPLSRITAASLADMGYAVNLGATDPYVVPLGAVRAHGERDGFWIEEELLGPIGTVDDSGAATSSPPP